MNVSTAQRIVNKTELGNLPLKKKWQAIFIQASLHLRGYQPSFKDLSSNEKHSSSCFGQSASHGYIEPANYGGADYDYYFSKFLFSRHPRENGHTREWRLSQYRPLTKAPLMRLLDIVQNGLFADSQYSLSISDKDDQDYIYETLDLFGFINRNLPKIIEDPNGYIALMPSVSRTEQAAKKLELKLLFIHSKDIIHQKENELIFEAEGKMWLFDENSIFEFVKGDDGTYAVKDPSSYYTHLIGKPTAVKAGGILNNEGFCNSFFDKAFPVCDEFVAVYSASQMIDKEASHPYIIMAKEDCATCQGNGSIQVTCQPSVEHPDGHKLETCGTCKGTGTISFAPGDRYEVPADKMNLDIVKIVNPNTSINEYHSKKQDKLYSSILDALDLLHVSEAQSGTAKALDRDKLFQFLGKLATHIFDNLIHSLVGFAIQYRNIQVDTSGTIKPAQPEFTLIKPTQFQIQSSGDLMLEWEESSKAGTPGFFRKKILTELADKRFAGDKVFVKKTEVITTLDDLSVYSQDEIAVAIAGGSVTAEEARFSRKLPSVIDKIIKEQSEQRFLEMDLDKITELVSAKIEIPV